jgi:hypothetical protein
MASPDSLALSDIAPDHSIATGTTSAPSVSSSSSPPTDHNHRDSNVPQDHDPAERAEINKGLLRKQLRTLVDEKLVAYLLGTENIMDWVTLQGVWTESKKAKAQDITNEFRDVLEAFYTLLISFAQLINQKPETVHQLVRTAHSLTVRTIFRKPSFWLFLMSSLAEDHAAGKTGAEYSELVSAYYQKLKLPINRHAYESHFAEFEESIDERNLSPIIQRSRVRKGAKRLINDVSCWTITIPYNADGVCRWRRSSLWGTPGE